VIIVGNKVDLAAGATRGVDAIVSAKRRTGVDALFRAVADRLVTHPPLGDLPVQQETHRCCALS
jgi:hypothetical protein